MYSDIIGDSYSVWSKVREMNVVICAQWAEGEDLHDNMKVIFSKVKKTMCIF